MAYYSEPVLRAPNHKGRLRLTSVLASLPGAVGNGFDGNGVAPRRRDGSAPGRLRVWWFDSVLPLPLPPGVRQMTVGEYSVMKAQRDATKPVKPERVSPVDPLDAVNARLDALERA